LRHSFAHPSEILRIRISYKYDFRWIWNRLGSRLENERLKWRYKEICRSITCCSFKNTICAFDVSTHIHTQNERYIWQITHAVPYTKKTHTKTLICLKSKILITLCYIYYRLLNKEMSRNCPSSIFRWALDYKTAKNKRNVYFFVC